MKQTILWVVILWFFSGCGSTHYYYPKSVITPHPYPAPTISPYDKNAFLRAINNVRNQSRYCGKEGYFARTKPLKWSDALYRSAYEHARDMLQTKRFTHTGSHRGTDWTARAQSLSGGSSFRERIENNGFTKWKHISENIGTGHRSLDEVMYRWLNSPRHCKNIMNPLFTHFGMVHISDQSNAHYWVQDFAAHQ